VVQGQGRGQGQELEVRGQGQGLEVRGQGQGLVPQRSSRTRTFLKNKTNDKHAYHS